MKMTDHPNIVRLKHNFFTHTEKDETYLHLVLEYVPDTVYRISKHYAKNNQRMPNLFVKLYTYQMCRALAHIHKGGVCHRDIKPQNLLVNTETHTLKLCDFGSAKVGRPLGSVRLLLAVTLQLAALSCLASHRGCRVQYIESHRGRWQ